MADGASGRTHSTPRFVGPIYRQNHNTLHGESIPVHVNLFNKREISGSNLTRGIK